MIFLPNKSTMIAIGIAAVLTPAAYFIGHWKGYSEGKADVQIKTVVKAIEVREVQNEVRNYRPDDKQLFDSMLSGQF